MSGTEVMNGQPVMSAAKCGYYGHRNSRGEPCGANVISGTTTCRRHAGKPLAQAKAEGAVRMDLLRWVPGTPLVDPTEQYLRLITQSAMRAQAYAAELDTVVERAGSLEKALTGDSYTATADGGSVKVGEYVRALTQLEMAERKFCADMCAKAITAGLEERLVRVAESTGALLAHAVDAILTDLMLTPEQLQRVPSIVPRRLREITAGAA